MITLNFTHTSMKKHFTVIALALIASSCKTTSPFLLATIYNENVYKTKDTLDLVKTYDKHKHRPVAKDDTVYRVIVDPVADSTAFIRYKIIKDGDKQYIDLLPRLKYNSLQIELPANDSMVKVKEIHYSKPIPPSGGDPTRFYYKIATGPKDLSPEQQYLASEHITGVPMVIPYKFRFNVPSTQDIASLNPSIAYTFGVRFKLGNDPYKNNYFRLIPFGIGIGSDTYVNRDSVFVKSYKGESTISLTYCFGGTFEFNDKFNFGLFVGADRMFGNKQNWYFQNKAWLGIGFGIKFGSDK
ncbi:hypothetical protein BH09BAC6_BH09BAC6_14750 [soil metagenome]